MDKNTTKGQNRPLCLSIEPIRVLLVLIVLAAVMLVLTLYGAISEQSVYACHEKDNNPTDIQVLCKQLTKNQWWGAYYGGKK